MSHFFVVGLVIAEIVTPVRTPALDDRTFPVRQVEATRQTSLNGAEHGEFRSLALATIQRIEASLPAAASILANSSASPPSSSSTTSWSVPPVALGSAWSHHVAQEFQLHSQPFLRVRSPSASTVEGINRALIEFECPTKGVERVELWLSGRDSTEPLVDLIGYTADGQLDAGDAIKSGSPILAFRQLRNGPTVIDVTDLVKLNSAFNASHVGFRLQLNDEANAPIGLNVRTEWDSSPTLVVYPTCYADCESASGSTMLDLFDFLCFQQEFLAGSPYACNCNTTTGFDNCDLFDFLCFQREFMAGCQ